MNYLDAQKILNAVRDGADYPIAIINKALELTGDISGNELQKLDAGMRGTGVDCEIQNTQPGIWCSRSPRLVGIDNPGNRKAQGQICGRSTTESNE